MGLEDILKPFLWLDREIRNEYTRVGKRIPEDSLRSYCNTLNVTGFATTYVGVAIGLSLGTEYFLDLAIYITPIYTIDLMGSRSIKRTTEVLDYWGEEMKYVLRNMRLPVILTGAAFLGATVYALGKYAFDSTEGSIVNVINYGFTGADFLLVASSMYLKDQDPECKDPLWKRAYDYVAEKAAEIVPQPIPVPVPVRRYVSIEPASF